MVAGVLLSCGVHEREAVYAAQWAAGAFRGATLHTADGTGYRVIYEGRRGGPAGPDFRDALLVDSRGDRLCGDVELHLRSSGWHAHGHDRDARYAGVVLHVVVHPPVSGEQASPLVTGAAAPIVLLGAASGVGRAAGVLPCAGLASRLGASELRALLDAAGDARFVARAEGFRSRLAGEMSPAAEVRDGAWRVSRAGWRPVDRVLFAALAEALGYGRDRAALRLAGERLAEGNPPEQMRAQVKRAGLPAVERTRLRGLLELHRRWEERGPWAALRRILEGCQAPRAVGLALVEALRVDGGAISAGRAAIVAANVALPFASGWAAWAGERELGERARAVFAALPGLPSNAITRLMARQFGLPRLPAGARAQQGLHHIWAGRCREKRCEHCPCNLLMREPRPLCI
ncbi:MAG TPA: DUF2851 family protein [Ktedonobacterales bacterium]|nr:DUF2851 family protein [Ktedonobacterales bacterium]